MSMSLFACVRVQTPGSQVCTQKKPGGFFWYTHLKNPPPKNPHFYFNLILVYTLYATKVLIMQYFIVFKAYTILVYTLHATNNAIFYCFKAFKALSY